MKRAFLLFSVFCLSNLFAQTIITLKESAKAKGFYLFLQDIAKIRGNKSIGKIYLGETPPINEMNYYDRDFIASKMERQGFDPNKIIWKGAESVMVRTQAMTLSPQETSSMARDFLRFNLPWSSRDVKCDLLIFPTEMIYFPAPRKSLKITPRFKGTPKNRGRVSIEIVISVDGRQIRRFLLIFQVRVFQYVLITRHYIPRHRKIRKKDLRLKRLETTALRYPPLTNYTQLKYKQARYPLGANRILTTKDLEDSPVVRRGSKVTVIIHSGNLKVTVPAKALQNGRKGENIRVFNLSSRKTIKAIVVDNTTVTLKLE